MKVFEHPNHNKYIKNKVHEKLFFILFLVCLLWSDYSETLFFLSKKVPQKEKVSQQMA